MKLLTTEERDSVEKQVLSALFTLATTARADLQQHATKQIQKLTDDELQELTRHWSQWYRAARVFLCGLGPDRLEKEFQTESTKRDTRRLRRWLRNRP